MIFQSPAQEMIAVRRAAARSGCVVRELSIQNTAMGPRAVGKLECADGWGAARLLFEQAKGDAETAGARDLALELRRQAPSDDAFARLVHSYVKEHVAFVREQGEVFTGSAYTLGTAGGDCDDHARLVYAIASAGGLPARLAFLHHVDNGDPTHAVAQLRANGRYQWAETTVDARFGEHPLEAASRLGLLDEREDLATEVRIMSEQDEQDQRALFLAGFLSEPDEPVTREVIKLAQRSMGGGLIADGILGPKTRRALAIRIPQDEFGMGYLAAAEQSASADLSDEFLRQWNAMCGRLGINAIDLASVGFSETGLRGSGQTGGLIGFVPDTIKGLGWTGSIDEFWSLSPIDQIPYVEKYYSQKDRRYLDSAVMIYVANYLPIWVKSAHDDGSDSFVLAQNAPRVVTVNGKTFNEPRSWYHDNPVLDTNKDGVIDVGDLRVWLSRIDKNARWQSILARLEAAGVADNRTAPSFRTSLGGMGIVGTVLLFVVAVGAGVALAKFT